MTVDLSPDSIEAVARRVVELLSDGTPQLLDAATVAERLGRSREWVYRNAEALGAVRVGEGDRPRLGFDPAKVAAYVDGCSPSRRTQRGPKPGAKRKSPTRPGAEKAGGADLLPIRGEAHA